MSDDHTYKDDNLGGEENKDFEKREVNSIISNFMRLYEEGAKKNLYLEKEKVLIFNRLKKVKKTKRDINNLITSITIEIFDKIEKKDSENENYPESIENIYNFAFNLANNFKKATEISEIVICKPPLESDLTFDDIAGLEQEKSQMAINFINPFIYKGLYRSIGFPKGILLYGVPGTGKTLLIKASVKSVPNTVFYAPSNGDLKGKYEGETEKNLQSIFNCAKERVNDGSIFKKDESGNLIKDEDNSTNAAIIFFDEFEAIGSSRSEGGDSGSTRRTVTTLLTAMDGIVKNNSVAVIAATNYPNLIDSAIKRRFSVQIFIDLPNDYAIEFIIREALSLAYGKIENIGKKELLKKDFFDLENDPNKTLQKQIKKYNNNAEYMKNIKERGGFEGETDVININENPGIMNNIKAFIVGSKIKIPDKYIDNEFIKLLVDKFGPKSKGKDIKNEINNKKIPEETDDRLKESALFGYSPSDITKIMEMAIKFASTRCINGYCRKMDYTSIKSNKQNTIYIYDWNIIEEDNINTFKTSNLSSTEKKNVYNFDIRQSDINLAIDKLGSSIENLEYLRIFIYSRSGQ